MPFPHEGFALLEAEGNLDDIEELWLLGLINNRVINNYSPQPRIAFDIEKFSDEEILLNFRFAKDDIFKLIDYLDIPDNVTCSNRTKTNALEGFCILLRRLAYPNRLCDLKPMFGRSKTELSVICKEMLEILYNKHGHLLQNINRRWLQHDDIKRYAAAVHAKGAPLKTCWGFIDGTCRPICRPSRNQRIVYSGHKRIHGLKYQSLVSPDGLIVNLYGPVEGRRHDSYMLRASNILEDLENLCGQQFCVYGDPGYPLRSNLIVPFRGANLTPEQETFNASMSSVRESVEWVFGKVLQNFAFLDYKKNLKLYLQPVGKLYIVGALLTNLHTCLYGGTTSTYFNVEPPSVAHYLEVDQL